MSTEAGTVYVGAIALPPNPAEKENNKTKEAEETWVITMYDDKKEDWRYWDIFGHGHGVFRHAEAWSAEPPYIPGPAGSILFGKVRHEKVNEAMEYIKKKKSPSSGQGLHLDLSEVWRELLKFYEGVDDVGDVKITHVRKAEKEISEAMDRTRSYRGLDPIPTCRVSWNGRKSLLDIALTTNEDVL